jgi:hypothetical protein
MEGRLKMKLFQTAGLLGLVLMTVAVKTAGAQTTRANSNPSWDLQLRCDRAQCPPFGRRPPE